MGKEFYFETDDRLDRKKYAEFLKTLLEHCDEYRREDSDGAYVIAIDSPWGTGKTRFAKMLRNYLEDRTKKMGDDSAPGEKAAFNAIYYNSWDTDFSDDALQPLIYTITNAPEFKPDEFDNEGKKILEKFKKSAIAVAKVVGLAMIHHFFGETAAQIAKTIDDSTSEKTPNPLEEYQTKLNLLQGFKDSLQELIQQTRQKKLVIIVDELDRCRPTFAIQTLEIVKHLFEVEDLVFIFALDIKQLSSSVKTVYGQELDSTGYLCRFFDYIGQLTNPDLRGYISSTINSKKCLKGITGIQNHCNSITSHIYNSANYYNLKLRDISTIILTYKIMIDVFLRKYGQTEAHKIYICLLVIKYKDIELYNKILRVQNGSAMKAIEIITGQEQKDLISYCDSISHIIKPDIIKEHKYILLKNGKNTESTNREILIKSIEYLDEKHYFRINYTKETKKGNEDASCVFDTNSSLSNVLFFPDLLRWGSICNMTLSSYFRSQLEMFNFALPSTENPPEA